MRRNDREVLRLDHILSILDKCYIMRIGLCVGEKPYIIPMNFAYETTGGQVEIYFHCASEGKKMDMIAQNNNACFEADCSYKTLTAKAACHWSAEYESVVGEGVIAVLKNEALKVKALNLLMERYGFPGKPVYRPRELEAVSVLKLSVSSMTGKRNLTQT